MSDTANMKLPLLHPSQAQKHVTVNEALVRVDALSQLCLQSRSVYAPPEDPPEGSCFVVPVGAGGGWFQNEGSLAVFSNGGWVFIQPKVGWRGWIRDENCEVVCLSDGWYSDILAISQSGTMSRFSIDEKTFYLADSVGQEVPIDILPNDMVFACSARVSEDIQGTASAWSLGFSDEPEKFGTGMGLLAGSYCTGVLSQPTTYYSVRRPLVTPVNGSFSGGVLTVAVHYYRIGLVP